MNSREHLPTAAGRVPGQPALSAAQIQPTDFVLEGERFASIQHMVRALKFLPGSEDRTALALNDPPMDLGSTSLRDSAELCYWKDQRFTTADSQFAQLMRAAQAAVRGARGIQEDPRYTTANVVSSSSKFGLCSNFAQTPFTFNGVEFASAEAFIHYIKFAPTDPRRDVFPALSGVAARTAASEVGTEIQQALIEDRAVFVYWNEEKYQYRSDAHFGLIEQALTEKFRSSSEARAQLLATGDKTIVHNTGRPESRYTSFPSEVFCKILTRIRERIKNEEI